MYLILIFGVLTIYSAIIMPLDGDLWLKHTTQFQTALTNRNFSTEYLDKDAQMHPGLTVEWLTLLALNLLPKSPENIVIDLLGHKLILLNVTLNLIFCTLMSICLIFGYYIYSKVFSQKVILLSALYTALLTNLIQTPSSTYLDWILCGTIFLVSALWTDYLRLKSKKNIIFIGIVLGLSILTKYSSILIFPAFLITGLIVKGPIKSLLKSLSLILFVAFVTYLLVNPAVWLDPGSIINNLIGNQESIFRVEFNWQNILSISEKFINMSKYFNPVIFLGLPLIIYSYFDKNITKTYLIPGVFGFIYLFLLLLSTTIVFYAQKDPFILIGQFTRYTLPVVILFTLPTFEIIIKSKKINRSFQLGSILIYLLITHQLVSSRLFQNFLLSITANF